MMISLCRYFVLSLGLCLSAAALPAQTLTTLANQPDWKALDAYQQKISKADFIAALNTIFAPAGASAQTIGISGNGADIVTELGNARKGRYRLLFAPAQPQAQMQTQAQAQAVQNNRNNQSANAKAQTQTQKTSAPYWKDAQSIRALATPEAPLKGLHVAIDPGHIGGQWGAIEQREWAFGGGPIFREGDFVLRVAQILADDLRAQGATVTVVRDSAEPVTSSRPEDFEYIAIERLSRANPGVEPSAQAIRRERDMLFYRVAEIRARAAKINNEIRPDIVLCLHTDGTTFPPAGSTALPRGQTLHLLVNGAYSTDELAYDDQRLAMLLRLLSGTGSEEIALSDAVARQLATNTGLPPQHYSGSNAVQVNDNPYLWARNLIANRLYDSPTVFIEAYTANREPFYSRYRMGEYQGTRMVDGQPRKNLWREYADSVRDALLAYYAPDSTAAPAPAATAPASIPAPAAR